MYLVAAFADRIWSNDVLLYIYISVGVQTTCPTNLSFHSVAQAIFKTNYNSRTTRKTTMYHIYCNHTHIFTYVLATANASMASHCNLSSVGLDDIQTKCLNRLLREANLLPDESKSDLDRMVEANVKAADKPLEDPGSLPTLSDRLWNGELEDPGALPTLSDRLWNGELEGEPYVDQLGADTQHTSGTAMASTSKPSQCALGREQGVKQTKVHFSICRCPTAKRTTIKRPFLPSR